MYYCADLGIKNIFVTVDEDNLSSQKVEESLRVLPSSIKKLLGVKVSKRYYWIKWE